MSCPNRRRSQRRSGEVVAVAAVGSVRFVDAVAVVAAVAFVGGGFVVGDVSTTMTIYCCCCYVCFLNGRI